MELTKTVADQFVAELKARREKAFETAQPLEAVEVPKAQAFKAVAVDNELGIVIGIGAAVGSPTNLDLDGEFIEKGEIGRAHV